MTKRQKLKAAEAALVRAAMRAFAEKERQHKNYVQWALGHDDCSKIGRALVRAAAKVKALQS